MAHKWQSRIEYKVKFLFDDPKGPYTDLYDGESWMYSVIINGEEVVFYATPTLKADIEKYGCRKDGVYYICKAEAEDGSWIGWLIGDDLMDENDKMRFLKRQIEMSERTPAPSRPKIAQNSPLNAVSKLNPIPTIDDRTHDIHRQVAFKEACKMFGPTDDVLSDDQLSIIRANTDRLLENVLEYTAPVIDDDYVPF